MCYLSYFNTYVLYFLHAIRSRMCYQIKCIDVLFRNLICITLFDKYLYFECLQYVQGAEIDM